jgi:alkylation response protein AidB-like acyl-CoA dehydrogenase
VSDPNLLYTEVEDDLRSTLRDLLTDRCDPASVAATYDGDRSVVPVLWKSLSSELGLAGLLVPEDRGGVGASAREAGVVLEELGRAAAPVPFLTSAVIATTLLLATDSELVSSLAGGDRTAAVVVPWSTPADGSLPAAQLVDDRLTGTITSVAGVLEADVLLVPTSTPAGIAAYAVAASDATLTPVSSLDMTRQLADVHLDDATGTLLLADAEPALRAALEAGAALLSSEQVGLARWCLEATVDYLKQRRQFGRVVGGFQAIKHRLADLYTGVESASAAARYAATVLSLEDPDVPVALAVAGAYCGDLAVTAAEEAVQLHGGIGMTWEHPAHLCLKRAKADQLAFGGPGRHRARLGRLVGLPS